MSNEVLGVFDSGLGGLTVVHAIQNQIPGIDLLYLGDTARVPYGTRSEETIKKYAKKCAQALVTRGVSAIVVACNTVSATALPYLRSEFSVPIHGVIEPGARAAVRAAQNNTSPVVGVLGTPRTIVSQAYPLAIRSIDPSLQVFSQKAPLFVPLVEEGWISGEVPELVAKKYLEPLLCTNHVRTLILGCTHYPILRPVLQKIAHQLIPSASVQIVDGGEELAREISPHFASAPHAIGSLEVLVTDLSSDFEVQATRFLGAPPHSVTLIDL